MAVLAPIPRASVRMTVREKPGNLSSWRMASRRSCMGARAPGTKVSQVGRLERQSVCGIVSAVAPDIQVFCEVRCWGSTESNSGFSNAPEMLPHGRRGYRVHLFDNRLRVNLVFRKQFVGFAAVRNLPHCEPMNSHSFRPDCLADGVADASSRVVVLH